MGKAAAQLIPAAVSPQTLVRLAPRRQDQIFAAVLYLVTAKNDIFPIVMYYLRDLCFKPETDALLFTCVCQKLHNRRSLSTVWITVSVPFPVEHADFPKDSYGLAVIHPGEHSLYKTSLPKIALRSHTAVSKIAPAIPRRQQLLSRSSIFIENNSIPPLFSKKITAHQPRSARADDDDFMKFIHTYFLPVQTVTIITHFFSLTR